ncbi:MAG TPA: cytochrome c [Desulfuromonadales bacterium]|nr:cytochrome c [Desulfuromonadales bacterium]
MSYAKNVLVGFCVLVASALQCGCGSENETNAPAIKLTASTVASGADATAHVHTVTIPFTDISPVPVADVYQFRSEVSNGHSHVIALSKQQVIDLNNGMRLALASSAANSGTSHTHSWSIQGGSVLYEKNCYNCHSNDKRNHNPMNVSFNSSQISAVMNPGSAPLSTSTPATPDPNYSPSTAVSLDGSALYAANCSAVACHGPLATSSKQNKTYNQIKTAITNNSGGMSSLGGLTDAQLQAIATALIK